MATLPAPTLWLIAGMICLAVGLLVPEPSIPALGFAAILTAIAASYIASPIVQMVLWGILAVTLTSLMRGLLPKESKNWQQETEAWVTTGIPAGGIGQVMYEGCLWQARCSLEDLAIAPEQQVYVIGRRGNTLIVLPSNYLKSNISDEAY